MFAESTEKFHFFMVLHLCHFFIFSFLFSFYCFSFFHFFVFFINFPAPGGTPEASLPHEPPQNHRFLRQRSSNFLDFHGT